MDSPGRCVQFLPDGASVRVEGDETLLAAAHWAGVRVESTCGGRGTCGRCRVQVLQGIVPPSPAERRLLDDESLGRGWRLACRTPLEEDTICRIPSATSVGPVRAEVEGIGRRVAVEPSVRAVTVELGPFPQEEPVGRFAAALRSAGHEVAVDPDLLEPLSMGGCLESATAILHGDRLLDVRFGAEDVRILGVAVDLGTTTVAAALLDLRDGEILATASVPNRQAVAGADVVSRAGHARFRREGLGDLQRLAVETANGLVDELVREARAYPHQVYDVVVVGNATMLHLLLGEDPFPLTVTPFTPAFVEALDLPAADLRRRKAGREIGSDAERPPAGPGLEVHPRARLQTFPLVGANVGGDTVAALLATDLARGGDTRLLVDLGTNTEVALATEGRVTTTSAPAGPAFEGGEIACGMPAVTGAVAGVRLRDGVELDVVGGGRPRGICGTGLIDVAAELRRSGLLDRRGRLAPPEVAGGHPLAKRLCEVDGIRAFRLCDGIHVSQRDLRELQTAVAAVAAAIRVLMAREGVGVAEIEEVCLAGAFGSAVSPENAGILGLLPAVPPERVRPVGNAAIEGAKLALLSFREREVARQIPSRVGYLELSAQPDFNDEFLAALELPAREGGS